MDNYRIENLEHYFAAYRTSIEDPDRFWESIAEEHFVWRKKWDKVVEYDLEKAQVSWFINAKLNITENCIDRHLETRGDKTAIIFEPNDPQKSTEHISYKELHSRVCKFANVLKAKGVGKGDVVCTYMPMIPELAVCVLACARIGAIHSVVFGGFSSTALATRINDCNAKLLVTADGSYRGDKIIELKAIADEALENCPTIESVLVRGHCGIDIEMKEGRDFLIQPLLNDAGEDCPAEEMDAEDPLFILYTSGSTGKPKGMMHTTAGYMVYTAYTFDNIFRCEEEDVYWCTADIGWITGHSYIVYGPLANGATSLMFEGIPSYPDFGRFWDIVQKHKVTHFYTAPTAIRSLAKHGDTFPHQYDLSSLKILGSVGEPINEEAWNWYNTHIGQQRCPIADTWWQTETGGFMITPIPFVTPTVATFATLPLPGVQPVLMGDNGKELTGNNQSGDLCIAFPWPSMARTIWGDHERYKRVYFEKYPGKYFSGDGAYRNSFGYYRITGRADDVIIVSGHNLGTAPIENAINSHHLTVESAIVAYPHDVKGNALYGFITLKDGVKSNDALKAEINQLISNNIGPIAKLGKIQFVPGLPKTRSGKIMRRILRKIAQNDTDNMGDVSTLLNPDIVETIKKGAL